ncbi:MAG: N-formylglutamate amidohydrolase [Gemmatimonadota bacterium]
MIHVLVSCEHAGNRVPPEWEHLFREDSETLLSHRGWDPGSREVAETVARTLEAPFHPHEVTRLLADTNRSPDSPTLFGERIRVLPGSERERILEEHHEPHRKRVEGAVAKRVSTGPVLHVSVHTFTPVLDGERRTTGVGILYDPDRGTERRIAEGWLARLESALPRLELHPNRPYTGVADGLTTALRSVFDPFEYSGIEVEVRSDLVHGQEGEPKRFGRILAQELVRVFGPLEEEVVADWREGSGGGRFG